MRDKSCTHACRRLRLLCALRVRLCAECALAGDGELSLAEFLSWLLRSSRHLKDGQYKALLTEMTQHAAPTIKRKARELTRVRRQSIEAMQQAASFKQQGPQVGIASDERIEQLEEYLRHLSDDVALLTREFRASMATSAQQHQYILAALEALRVPSQSDTPERRRTSEQERFRSPPPLVTFAIGASAGAVDESAQVGEWEAHGSTTGHLAHAGTSSDADDNASRPRGDEIEDKEDRLQDGERTLTKGGPGRQYSVARLPRQQTSQDPSRDYHDPRDPQLEA